MYLNTYYIYIIICISVCSDVGTLMSSDRNYQDDLDISMSTTDMEGIIFLFLTFNFV